MGTSRRLIKIAGLLALTGGVTWKTFVNSVCWRTPWTEISGNPLLKNLLVPSVFYIRSVSLLDVGLDHVIKARGVEVPRSYRGRGGNLYLSGRIRFLSDQCALQNGVKLHEIRERRNALAHDIRADVEWSDFETDAAEVERTLRRLDRGEADAVAEFRAIACLLQHPAHKKFYFGVPGMITAATVDGLTILYLDRQLTRALESREE